MNASEPLEQVSQNPESIAVRLGVLTNARQCNFSRSCTFPSCAGKQRLPEFRGLCQGLHPHGLFCRFVPKMLQHLLVHRRMHFTPTPSPAHMDVCRHMLRVPGHILVPFLITRVPCVILTPDVIDK